MVLRKPRFRKRVGRVSRRRPAIRTRVRIQRRRWRPRFKRSRYSKKTMSMYKNRRRYKGKLARLFNMLDQSRKSTWISSENLRTTLGNQNVSWWLSNYGQTLPTVDPGTAMNQDLPKIWWEETDSGVGNRTRKIYIDKSYMEYQIVNNSEASVEVTIYNIVYRKDCPLAPSALWENGMIDTNAKFIEAGANITPSMTTLGVTPFHSSLFCQYIKVLKGRKIKLIGGASYVHKMVYNVKRSIDGEWFRLGVENRAYFTHGILVVVKGQLMNDLNSAGEIQYAVGSINTVMKKTISWRVDATENRDKTYYYNNLSNKTGVTAPQFIKIQAGAIDNTPVVA